jgi:hypothetical protein
MAVAGEPGRLCEPYGLATEAAELLDATFATAA